MTRYALHRKQKTERLDVVLHETHIDPLSKAAFRALAAAEGLSMRAALTQLAEQHLEIREPFSPRRPQTRRLGNRVRYTSALPEVVVSPGAFRALQLDAERAGIRLTEALRQLVWRCVQASG